MMPIVPIAATALEAEQPPAYRECSELASQNPEQALIKAEAWLAVEQGIPAQHCKAMALFGLRRFDEAGDALSSLRTQVPSDDIALRSYLTHQAAYALTNADRSDKALALLATQIEDMNQFRGDNINAAKLTSGLLLHRARIHRDYGRLTDAVKDLDRAVSLTPLNEEVLLTRAAVFEKLGDLPLARSDVDAVLTLNRANPAAKAARKRLGE